MLGLLVAAVIGAITKLVNYTGSTIATARYIPNESTPAGHYARSIASRRCATPSLKAACSATR